MITNSPETIPPPEGVNAHQEVIVSVNSAHETSEHHVEEEDDRNPAAAQPEYPSAKYGITAQGNPMLIVTVEEGVSHSFMLQIDREFYQRWVCIRCRGKRQHLKANNVTPLPTVSSLKLVKDGNVIDTADILQLEHCCEVESVSQECLQSEQIVRIIAHEVRQTQEPPAEAVLRYCGLLTESMPEIMNNGSLLVDKKALERRFRRHKATEKPKTVNPHEIPPEIQRSLLPDGGNVIKYFAEEGPPLIVMADDHNLQVLRGAKDVIMDGTFSRAPEKTRQLYSLHAMYMNGSEYQKSFVSAVMVLSSASEETYTTELRRLRSLMEQHGPILIERFHLDCEEAMINAVKTVFPESQIVLCFFHFVKNLYDKLNKSRAHDLKRHAEFKRFMRVIRGSVFLPLDVYHEAFPKILLEPPEVGDTLKQKLNKFLNYLSEFIFRRGDFLNQFENPGPRTTNRAEGYHCMLRTLFPEAHPEFGLLIDKFKEVLRASALAFRNSADGTQLERRTRALIESDSRISAAKAEFVARYRSNLVNLAEIKQYCRHQALNASQKNYSEADPDAIYPNFAAMQTEARELTVRSAPVVQRRRRRAIPAIPTRNHEAMPAASSTTPRNGEMMEPPAFMHPMEPPAFMHPTFNGMIPSTNAIGPTAPMNAMWFGTFGSHGTPAFANPMAFHGTAQPTNSMSTGIDSGYGLNSAWFGLPGIDGTLGSTTFGNPMAFASAGIGAVNGTAPMGPGSGYGAMTTPFGQGTYYHPTGHGIQNTNTMDNGNSGIYGTGWNQMG